MKFKRKTGWFVLCFLLGVIFLRSGSGIDALSVSADAERVTSVEKAITEAAVQCYAIEGSYPPTIDYLVEHYGVVINESAYYYHYDAMASNILPVISVYKKW